MKHSHKNTSNRFQPVHFPFCFLRNSTSKKRSSPVKKLSLRYLQLLTCHFGEIQPSAFINDLCEYFQLHSQQTKAVFTFGNTATWHCLRSLIHYSICKPMPSLFKKKCLGVFIDSDHDILNERNKYLHTKILCRENRHHQQVVEFSSQPMYSVVTFEVTCIISGSKFSS